MCFGGANIVVLRVLGVVMCGVIVVATCVLNGVAFCIGIDFHIGVFVCLGFIPLVLLVLLLFIFIEFVIVVMCVVD